MPRVSDDGFGGYAGPVCPGLYRHLLERRCRRETEPDPRLVLTGDLRQLAAYDALKVEAEVEAERLLAEWLVAGEPVGTGYLDVVGGHHGLPRDHAPEHWQRTDRFLVHADDTIELTG